MPKDYQIIKDHSKLQLSSIKNMMQQTYWAPDRSETTIIKAIEHSVCYGVFDSKHEQIGFARVITDFATTYYICDVIIDVAHRGKGLGKQLLDFITNDAAFEGLYGLLVTADAHGFYQHHGFQPAPEIFMHSPRR
ncbi:MAG: GNAT family N-acetyltransferase [Acetobacterium sp. MES1]|uniref:GNAT family N-acetyltransferase n=1 Tax=Acetobacterium sp. MES1 TaxID=1899015 RepID=UPI000B9D42CF|nr:GNAT family N-acetyltransferase [Acetobacterium sp. MES1]OXS25705.1 MAG: GNAT family N-acetyltransferase [Acetobacterium sp. MES1]